MRRVFLAAALTLLLHHGQVALAGPISVVVPNSLAAAEGVGNNRFPFDITGLASSQRYQQVYAASQFSAFGGPVTISQLAFRPNGDSNGAPPAFSSTLNNIQINLSTTSAAPDALNSTFATNVGSDNTVVFNGSLSLSSNATGGPPRDFDILINLTTPFLYNPSLGNLLLDVRNIAGGLTTLLDATESVSGDAVSRVYTPVGGLVTDASGSTDSNGLVTQFTGTPVNQQQPPGSGGGSGPGSGPEADPLPEPTSFVVFSTLAVGAAGYYRLRRRKQPA